MRVLILLTFLLLPASGFALDAAEMFDDPAKEARAREIGRELRCLVCRNQSIFDSNAGIAKDLRIVVRERMELGETDEEIFDYVHQRFGDFVLLKPRMTTETLLLWGAPFILMALSGVALAVYLRGRQATPASDALSGADQAEARGLLGIEEGKS